MTIEEFLYGLPVINIVGGSPLYKAERGLPAYAISLNGLRDGGYAAAINCCRADGIRVRKWERVMVPNPDDRAEWPTHYMRPAARYVSPAGFPEDAQRTTCFSLLLICRYLGLSVNLFGVCGWASKWHDGDWEMHYIKRYMNNVTVHDPRPTW